MIRINIPWVIEVIEGLSDIDQIKIDGTVWENVAPLYSVMTKVEQVFDQSIYGHYLRASREAGRKLHSTIEGITDANADWETKKVTAHDFYSLKSQRDTFKTVLLADFSAVPSYLASPKDNFDVSLLIETGTKLFPAVLLVKAPETQKDAIEAGRALAFELPTACGFHAFRVIESVVRRHWDIVTKGQQRPRLETLGTFASELERQQLGDAKIVEALKQMTKLHRNPLIHPEVILTSEEAIGILGMARSVIGAMVQALPDVPATTGAPASPPVSEATP